MKKPINKIVREAFGTEEEVFNPHPLVREAFESTGKIVLPPRKFGPFISSLKKKILALVDAAEAFDKKVRALDKELDGIDGSSMEPLRGWYIEPGRYSPEDLLWFTERISRHKIPDEIKSIEGIVKLIETDKSMTSQEQLKFTGYVADGFKRIGDDLTETTQIEVAKNLLAARNWIDKTWERYAEPDYGQYHEAVKDKIPHLDRDDLEKFDWMLREAEKISQEAIESANRIKKIAEHAYGPYNDPKWKPKAEKIETLYHASINAAHIYQHGFDQKVPDTSGLGGSQQHEGNKAGISFTADLYIAKEIMRTLKEAVMIAHGQIKLRHILEWAEREGGSIQESLLKSIKLDKYTDEKPGDVMHVYRLYLAHSRKRYDPLFFGDMHSLMQRFKSVNPRNIGVLVAKVNIEDPDVLYLNSMYEYRVPVSAVVSIEKLIK